MTSKKEILEAIQNTTSNYDNKAASLLTAIGIIFGFSLFSLGELSGKGGVIRTLIIVVGSLYLLTFVFSISILILIIFPRRKRIQYKNQPSYYYNYYNEDIYKKINSDDFSAFISKDASNDMIEDQIKQCSRIAHIKETLLRVSVVSIIFLSILLVSLVVLLFL